MQKKNEKSAFSLYSFIYVYKGKSYDHWREKSCWLTFF